MSDDNSPKRNAGNIRPALKVSQRRHTTNLNLTTNSNSSESKIVQKKVKQPEHLMIQTQINSGEHHVRWNEEQLAEDDKTRGGKMKIDEPKTPYCTEEEFNRICESDEQIFNLIEHDIGSQEADQGSDHKQPIGDCIFIEDEDDRKH